MRSTMNPSLRPDLPEPSLPFPEQTLEDCNNGTKESKEENHWDFCPNCSARLVNRGCKYRCPRCHYFMSCSDFD